MKKTGHPPSWGDEIEYAIVHLDHAARQATLSLSQSEVLKRVQGVEGSEGVYTAEFAKYMVESMPAVAYGGEIRDMLRVEKSMRER